MLLSISPPNSSMLETPSTKAPQSRNRSRSLGKPEPLATHRIINHPKSTTHLSTFEVQQKGRTALWAKTTKPVIGSSILQITTPKVDGEAIVATAKLRSDACKVFLGDPASKTRGEWTQISHSSSSSSSSHVVADIIAQFVYQGQTYIWQRAQQAMDCSSGVEEEAEDLHADLELVTPEDSETILAAYMPQRHVAAAAEDQIGKLDYMLDLGPKLELLCLTAVLGARQSAEMQKKRYSGPRFLADLQQSLLSAKGA